MNSENENEQKSKSLMEIYRKCYKNTRIYYNEKGFFTPRLRSINHLSIGRSKIISSKLTIFLELLFRLVMDIKYGLIDLWKKITPKDMQSKPAPGKHDSRLIGRITFGSHEDFHVPIHNMKVAFWARTWLFQWRKIADGITNRDGTFELPFHLAATKRWSVFKTVFEAYETSYTYRKEGHKEYHYRLFHSEKVPGSGLVGMSYNLRTIPLFYWEYRTDIGVPRVVIKDHDVDAPQYYSRGRIEAVDQQIIPIELTKLKHLEQIAHDPDSLTIEKIQSEYPENLTVCMENEQPGCTRGDEWFGRRMMNGMYAARFHQDADDPNDYWTRFYGACEYKINRKYAFPTVDIRFTMDDRGVMMPKEIHLTGPLTSTETDPWKTRVFTPEDGEKWLQAKRVARVTCGLSVELDDHLTGTHLNTEQFSIAAYRNLRLSPIAALLFPHLKEVMLVDHTADSILIGPADEAPTKSMIRSGGLIHWLQNKLDRLGSDIMFESGGYIPRASAMTHEGILQRVRDLLGVQDWKDWQPMESLSEAHTYPRAEKAYWDMLGDYLDIFFDENIEGIREHWYEVFCFSKDLVKHAVPLFNSDIDMSSLDKNQRRLAKQRMQWYQDRYHLDPSSPRDTIDGELKVLSPITHSEEFNEDDLQNLKSACQYMIMMSTFMHSWVNEHQYEDIGEVLYNCLGLRFGDGEEGVMAPESDRRIAPSLACSTQMMWFSNLLSRTEYGFIVRNEEHDINPLLVRMLKERKDEIEKNGMLIENIESRTNI